MYGSTPKMGRPFVPGGYRGEGNDLQKIANRIAVAIIKEREIK